MIKFLPSYVGSKSYWVEYLSTYKDMDFVELFAGSAVISANLAKSTILNDKDPFMFKILNNFNNLIVPDIFTKEDYFKYRGNSCWWKYSYCFQKMSFSGVFRYSKNGYNVPPKSNISQVSVKKEYELALSKWSSLLPEVTNLDYSDVKMSKLLNKVIIIDPPYENSSTAYNKVIDYHLYWEYIRLLEQMGSTILLFDNTKNIPFSNIKTRSMVVNGKYAKNEEGLFVFNKSLKIGHQGELEFLILNPSLTRTDGRAFDFIDSYGNTIELKSDYYDMDKTENFFIERFSYSNESGGPWQSLAKGVDLYVYFFIKNKVAFVFDTKRLVDKLEIICANRALFDVGNEQYITRGFKINRNELTDIVMHQIDYTIGD